MNRIMLVLLVSFTAGILVSGSSMESPRILRIDEIGMAAAPHLAPEETSIRPNHPLLTACNVHRDNCGSITPADASVFIADGAYNSEDGTLFFVDVPSASDGVFQLDPATCSKVTVSYYTVNSGLSQRGIGYDPRYHHIWVGGWNDLSLNQHSANPPYPTIENNYLGISIASIAVDPEGGLLFVGTNGSPDNLYVYDLSIGDLGDLLGVWTIPWQSSSDGYDMAGMSFDDDSGQLVMVNQWGGGASPCARETFDFNLETGLSEAGFCTLDNTEYAWGIGLIEDGNPEQGSYSGYHPDIASFGPPFDIDEYRVSSFDMCFKDQYENEYWFDLNFGERYVYGEIVMAQECDTDIFYLQGSFYFSTAGIEFELSAANPLGDADTMCVPCYKLKGMKTGLDWEFMWYYHTSPGGGQPAVLVPCSSESPAPVEGRGSLRE